MKKTKIPNPGTQAALDAGCSCPRDDNNYGEGMMIGGKQCFWYTEGCPIHSRAIRNLKAGSIRKTRKKAVEPEVGPMEWCHTYSDKADCCNACIHVFRKEEYDEDAQYYCAHGADLRPPCGSVFMKESFFSGIKKRFSKGGTKTYSDRHKAWNKWIECRGVSPWGRCIKFKRKDEGAI